MKGDIVILSKLNLYGLLIEKAEKLLSWRWAILTHSLAHSYDEK